MSESASTFPFSIETRRSPSLGRSLAGCAAARCAGVAQPNPAITVNARTSRLLELPAAQCRRPCPAITHAPGWQPNCRHDAGGVATPAEFACILSSRTPQRLKI
jgi:hypothetical protein